MTWYQRPDVQWPKPQQMASNFLASEGEAAISKATATFITSAAMLVLAAVQGLIRADVAFVAHLGIFLVSLTSAGNGFSLPRRVQMVVSGLAALIAGGIQYYLMHVVYPHVTWRNLCQCFSCRGSVIHPRRPGFLSLALSVPAWIWLATRLAKGLAAGDSPGIAIFVGSVIYLVMWVTVGNLDEVRIFLPYMAALIPLMCVCAMRQFSSTAMTQCCNIAYIIAARGGWGSPGGIPCAGPEASDGLFR